MAVSRFSTREPESRRLCPVCPGLPMRKVAIGTGPNRTTLDGCERCGGFWFDWGEVDQLRRLGLKAFETSVALRPESYRKRCGHCAASYPRNEDQCPACKSPNDLRCPVCSNLMEHLRTGTTKLDACRTCRGVWFDSVELKDIWNAALVRHRGNRGDHVATSVMDTFLLANLLMPGGSSVGAGAEDLAGGAAVIGEAGSGIVEASGEMASSIFDTIANLIAGIFE